MDTPVLIFAAVVAAVTACAVGLVPVRGVARSSEALRSGVMSTRRSSCFRGAHVVTQLAVSVVLLVGTSLLGRSLVSLLRVDIGVASDRVVAILMDLSTDRAFVSDQHAALADRLVERVGAMPGVESAAVGAAVPANRPRLRVSFELVDPSTGRAAEYLVEEVPITPGFLSVLRVPLIRGRWFSSSDTSSSRPVMILSRETARRFSCDEDPIGRTLPIGTSTTDGRRGDVTVVGVVGDLRYLGLEQVPGNTIYLPYPQLPGRSAFLIARTVSSGIRNLDKISHSISDGQRKHRGFNLFCGDDLALFHALLRGEFNISGFTNRRLRPFLGKTGRQVSLVLIRLRVHGLIKKVRGTYKYRLTRLGRRVVLTALHMRQMITPALAFRPL